MRDLILFFLILSSGYVASGVIASGFMLFSGRNPQLIKPQSEATRLAAVGLTIVTGPSILTSNAIRSRNDGQPPAYLAIVLMLSAAWSFIIGLFVVSVAITFPSPF
jgi:hypothetical protein